jgi:hypothetical protein
MRRASFGGLWRCVSDGGANPSSGTARRVGKAERDRFLQSLNDLPVLLPTAHSALRPTLDPCFETQGRRPRIVGEFEGSALLAVFAARGLGVFPVSRLGADDVGLARGLRLLGSSDGVKEEINAIRTRRVPPGTVVTARISAVKAGLDISINDLEAHHLAGGNVVRVVSLRQQADGPETACSPRGACPALPRTHSIGLGAACDAMASLQAFTGSRIVTNSSAMVG